MFQSNLSQPIPTAIKQAILYLNRTSSSVVYSYKGWSKTQHDEVLAIRCKASRVVDGKEVVTTERFSISTTFNGDFVDIFHLNRRGKGRVITMKSDPRKVVK